MFKRVEHEQNTGLKGQTVEALIERFYGKLDRWPIEPDGLNFTQDKIRRICQRIHETGDCLWHATSVVEESETCPCMKCERASGVMRGPKKIQ